MGIAPLGTNYFLLLYWVITYWGRNMAAQMKWVADAATSLKSDFLDAATRRRDEATKSPLDERYHEAMQLLAALAATVDQIERACLPLMRNFGRVRSNLKHTRSCFAKSDLVFGQARPQSSLVGSFPN